MAAATNRVPPTWPTVPLSGRAGHGACRTFRVHGPSCRGRRVCCRARRRARGDGTRGPAAQRRTGRRRLPGPAGRRPLGARRGHTRARRVPQRRAVRVGRGPGLSRRRQWFAPAVRGRRRPGDLAGRPAGVPVVVGASGVDVAARHRPVGAAVRVGGAAHPQHVQLVGLRPDAHQPGPEPGLFDHRPAEHGHPADRDGPALGAEHLRQPVDRRQVGDAVPRRQRQPVEGAHRLHQRPPVPRRAGRGEGVARGPSRRVPHRVPREPAERRPGRPSARGPTHQRRGRFHRRPANDAVRADGLESQPRLDAGRRHPRGVRRQLRQGQRARHRVGRRRPRSGPALGRVRRP